MSPISGASFPHALTTIRPPPSNPNPIRVIGTYLN